MGLSGSGTGFGSLFFVLIVNALLSSNGLPYALQIIALFELIGLLLATCLVCRFEEATAQSISINPVSPSTPPGIEVSTFSTDTQIVSIDKPCTGAVHDNADDATATNDHREQDEIESKLRPKSIWKSKKFIYLLIAFGVLSFGDTVPLIFLPLYAQSLGISVTQSNHLVAILGIGSGFGRIIIGYFADKFSKLWLLLLSLSICGILTLGWLGYDNYSALVLYAFFFGVFFGAYNILVGPISLELFGPAEVSKF